MKKFYDLVEETNKFQNFEIKLSNPSVTLNNPFLKEMVVSIVYNNSKNINYGNDFYGNFIMIYGENINENYLIKVVTYLRYLYSNSKLSKIYEGNINNNSDVTEDFERHIKG